MSKSELKRLCTLNPIQMAERLHELETQLDGMAELLQIAGEIRTQQYNQIEQLKTQLKTKFDAIQDIFSDALQSDLEHGVKWLNENASKEFHEKYPQLTLALQYLSDLK
jgi:hypothetical protein